MIVTQICQKTMRWQSKRLVRTWASYDMRVTSWGSRCSSPAQAAIIKELDGGAFAAIFPHHREEPDAADADPEFSRRKTHLRVHGSVRRLRRVFTRPTIEFAFPCLRCGVQQARKAAHSSRSGIITGSTIGIVTRHHESEDCRNCNTDDPFVRAR